MNGSAESSPRWTLRQWAYTIVFVFVLQTAAILLLGTGQPPTPRRPTFATRVHLLGEADAQGAIGVLTELIDPALFALPHPNGFSGSAWLQFPLLTHDPAVRSEPPRWLELEPSSLANVFVGFLATNGIAPPLLVDKPLPPVQRFEPNFPGETVPQQSRIRIQGALAGRELLTRLQPSSWAHSEILSNTTVQVVVDAAGQPFSATLLTRSGLAAADESALRMVTDARFKPRPPAPASASTAGARRAREEDLTWGRIIFEWHTLPLPGTNLLPPLP